MSLGFPKDRMTYGHMTADTEGLSEEVSAITAEEILQLRTSLNVSGIMLLYVAAVSERKGVRELLNAWREFESGNRKFRGERYRQITVIITG